MSETSSEIVCTPVTTIESFNALQSQWFDLTEKAETYSFFLSWEWLSTWWEVYHGDKTKLMLLTFRQNGDLVGLAPFYIDVSKNKKILQFIGMGEPEWEEVSSMYLDIICKPGLEKKISAMTWAFLSDNTELWDEAHFHDIIQPSLILDNLIEEIGAAGYNFFQKQVSIRYHIEMPGGWDEYIAHFSKNRRKKIRWNLNRLESLGEVKEYPVAEERDLEHAFDELVRLHTLRWEGKGEHGVFASERFLAFHRKLLQKVFALKRLDLRMISVDGKNISALYNFRLRDTIFTYQAGFETQEGFSLGFVADLLSIQAAFDTGCRIYDYMKGEQGSYKGGFQCEQSPMYSITIYNKSFNGQFSYLVEKAKDLARPIKRLITAN